jgi:signal transduction histidine kinase/ActR/RegA family two-component response regulator
MIADGFRTLIKRSADASAAARYGFALAAAIGASLLRIGLNPFWGPEYPYILFFPITLVAALVGGLGPGLLSLSVCGLFGAMWVLPPVGGFPEDPTIRASLAVYVFIDGLIAVVAAALRASQAEAEAARSELADRLRGLTRLAELSTRLVPKGALDCLLLEVLDAGIDITGADMGSVQLLNVETGRLEIIAQRGFEKVEEHEAAYGTAMATGERVLVENVAEHPLFASGEAGRVLRRAGVQAAQITPLMSPTGKVVGILSTHYRRVHRPEDRGLHLLDVLARLAADYIDRVRTEQEEEAIHARLEATDRAKDQFLAMLGHELRNPLGAIAGAVGVLQLAGESPQTVERTRTVIARQVQHLSRLVDDLLDVSRVTTGKVHLTQRPLNLADLVDSAVGAWRAAGRFQRHEVSTELAPIWINGDSTRIDQILDNLIGNALKYTPAGGRVTVRVGADGQDAVLQVADTGTGMAPALLESAFDLFVQGERGLDRSQGGLGLGLTLVKALTLLHGGTVSAASGGPGTGSVFTVRLPSVPAEAVPTASAPSAEARLSRRRILVIEDNADAREMLRIALTMAGHEVHEAADGETGVAMAGRVVPDILLVDVGLPGLDGYEVARRVRAGAAANASLIALTGYGQSEDRQRALEAGYDAHLVKPVVPEQLAQVIAESPGQPPAGEPRTSARAPSR